MTYADQIIKLIFSKKNYFLKIRFSIVLCLLSFTVNVFTQSITDLKHDLESASTEQQRCESIIPIITYYSDNGNIDSSNYYAALLLTHSLSSTNSPINEHASIAYGHLASAQFNKNKYGQADSLIELALGYTALDSIKASFYLSRFTYNQKRGLTGESTYLLDEARKHLKADTLGSLMARYLNSKGIVALGKGEYISALNYLQKAKQCSQHKGLDRAIDHNLSNVYYAIEAWDKVLEISTANKKSAQEEGKKVSELYALYSIAGLQLQLEDYDAAKNTCYEAINLKEKTGVSQAFGYIYWAIGTAHLKTAAIDSAIYYLNKGLNISNLQNELKERNDCLYGLIEANLEIGAIDKAKEYVVLLKNKGRSPNEKQLLARVYESDNDYKKAYAFMKESYAQMGAEKKNNSQYKVVNALLSNQYKQQQIQEKALFEQKSKAQKNKIALFFFMFGVAALFLIVFFQDRNVKQLNQINKKLSKRNQTLQQFTYITSHDLKEPLRSITSFSQLLKKNILQGKRDRKKELSYISFIEQSSSTLFSIIHSLKTYTDISLDNKKIVTIDFPVHSFFDSVHKNLEPLINEKKGTLQLINSDNIQNINYSEPLLVLIVQSLVQNGFKYNKTEHPKVMVTLKKRGSKLLFEVKDNGVGFSSEYNEYIFEPFKTLSNKSMNSSSGLGLAICKTILEKTGGSIWVEPNEKVGSTFSFVL